MTNGWKYCSGNVKIKYKNESEREEPGMFEGFDFSNFWEDSEYALKEYERCGRDMETVANGIPI